MTIATNQPFAFTSPPSYFHTNIFALARPLQPQVTGLPFICPPVSTPVQPIATTPPVQRPPQQPAVVPPQQQVVRSVPQVQHQVGRAHAGGRLRHDARGVDPPFQAAGRRFPSHRWG